MSWMHDEPVRGGYPDPAVLGLPGIERIDPRKRLFPAPPIAHLVGLRPVQGSYGSVTFEMPASPWLQSAASIFLAGTAALVADAALAGVIVATLPAGGLVVTSDLSFNFLRPAGVASGRLLARAQLIDAGRRLGLSQCLVEDGHGQVLAHATSRCFVLMIDDVPDASDLRPVEDQTHESPDPYERELTTSILPGRVWADVPFQEIVRRSQTGDLPAPPFADLFGVHAAEAGDGRFSQRVPASEWLASPAGTIYGGAIGFLLDSVMTGAMASVAPPGSFRVLPLDLKVNFVRPALPDGRDLVFTAEVVHRGRSFVTASGEVHNADGKVVAMASSSATIAAGQWSADATPADEAEPEQA